VEAVAIEQKSNVSNSPRRSTGRTGIRVLIVSQYFWPETFRINDVATSLATMGCQVTVLTGHPNYPDGKTLDGYTPQRAWWDQGFSNVEIARVPLAPRGQGAAIGLVLNYLSFVASAGMVGTWLLRRRQFDVIFVYGTSPILQALPAIWLKWVKRAPLVLWVQDLWPESLETTRYVRNRAVLSAVASLVRWIYRRSDLLLGQSNAFVRDLRAAVAGRVRVEYHPNPGDIRSTALAPPMAVPTLPPGFTVVFAGNLGVAQSLDTIVAAARTLRERTNITFVFVGDGSRRGWLETEVSRLDLKNVVLLGRFPAEAMPGILKQASALLVTLNKGPAMEKTVPSKISTYMEAGRPIVAAIDGEAADMVLESGGGIVCPAEDVVALASAIGRLASLDASLVAEMGRAGRRYYEANFEPKMLATRLVGYFEEVVAQAHPRTVAKGA
jgi:glycosyltransferase involved in cell wall biosynthesis